MVCIVDIKEKPKLNNPVLIEGLPGIGFVANIATLHLIRELKARLSGRIFSSAFQDLAVTTETGGARTPTSELYYHKSLTGGRDIILWYGNTQALTTFGQYELCEKVLEIVKELGCRYVITFGGFRQEEVPATPQIYACASDKETVTEALNLGAKMMVGQVYGIAGLLIGICGLREVKGLSLLVETLGNQPDANAAHQALLMLGKLLNMQIDLSRLEESTAETKKILESFGLVTAAIEEKKKEEQQFRWSV